MTTDSFPQSLAPASRADLVTTGIRVNGEPVSAEIQIASIRIYEAINKIPSAQVTIIDGTVNDGSFKLSDQGIFSPDHQIEIYIGYHSRNELAFKGIIISNSHRISNQYCEMHIECRDERIRMTEQKAGQNFLGMTDEDIVRQLLAQNNTSAVEWSGTSLKHEQLVQFHTTDWDFMISRIDVNGKICLLHNGDVLIKTPDLNELPALSLTHGASILEFQAEVDARVQNPVVKATAWNYADQELVTVEGEDPVGMDAKINAAGDASETVKEAIAGIASVIDKPYLLRAAPIVQEEQQSVADAKKLRQVLARVMGSVSYTGSLKALPGGFIELHGVGRKFDGKVFVSAIRHDCEQGNWITEATLGWDEHFFAEIIRPDHLASSAAQLSAVHGLHIGIVTDIVDDSGEYRVKLRLPLVNTQDEGIYARVATLDAGKNRGTFFRPEIDDEVLVGFMHDDPRHPVILGMLHSSNKNAPWEPENTNPLKGYVSRSGIKMSFDDEQKCLRIETPGSRVLEMDDDSGTVSVKDANGNKIVMDSNGVTIESAKNLVLKAAKTVSLSAPQVSIKADAAMLVEASGSTTVKSSGITEIKGAMVKIN